MYYRPCNTERRWGNHELAALSSAKIYLCWKISWLPKVTKQQHSSFINITNFKCQA